MSKQSRRKSIITTAIILGVLLLAIGSVALIKALSPDNNPYRLDTSNDARQEADDASAATPNETPSDEITKDAEATDDASNEDETAAAIAPEDVNEIPITQMGITVSYLKGAGGFEYSVLRTSNGTRYVEFSSPSLVGTKCTNDTGVFASIIANPGNSDSLTVAKTTTVDSTSYGLSLADATCTSDKELLATYQKAFSDPFTLLKRVD